MSDQDFKVTSYDPDALKASLIAFLKSKPEVGDFDYEGSAINTIVDLLVRNSHYMAFLANMTANESFLDTAQIRNNVVSHAQKLSYTPKSRTAAITEVGLRVVPASPSSKNNITMNKGSTFINTIDGVSYSFVNTEEVVLTKNISGDFVASNVQLRQGQLITSRYIYSGQPIEIQNKNVDSSTIKMYLKPNVSGESVEFLEVDDITKTTTEDNIFFLSENTTGNYQFEFGKDILGIEPVVGSIVEIEYVVVPDNHANGLGTLIAASTIEGFSDIRVTVTVPAYGGSEQDDIERIRFLAPRIYKAQNRAVTESDFEAIVLRDFPFIKSAIAWGGEKNDPPYYGRTYLSLIPVEGYSIVNSVKRAIENRLKEYTVMTTPFVTDANFTFLDLDINYIFDNTRTSDKEETIESKIIAAVNTYNQNSLRQFDFWYNESKLNKAITDINGVKSAEINKRAYQTFDVIRNARTRYQFNFGNEIRPNTFSLKGYILDIQATNDFIVDDGEGNLVRYFTKGVMINQVNVGTINYASGKIEFTLQFLIGSPETLNVYVEPLNDNFYTNRNEVVQIVNTTVNRIVFTDRV